MKISKRVSRQVQNLARICSFDTEKKIATVPLNYQTSGELLDLHLSRPGAPMISDETIDYLLDITADIPEEFSVEYALTIDDCGEYTHEQLLDAIRITIENTYYYHDEKKRKDNVLGAFFLIIGFLTLTVQTLGGLAGWLGENGSVMKSILDSLLDLATWVFLWEGCAILLLTYGNESTFFSHQMQRLNKVSIHNAGGQKQLSMDSEHFSKGWIAVGKKELFARGFILLSNTIFLASLIWRIFGMLTSKLAGPAVGIVFGLAECVLIILLVISNISFYLDHGEMKNYAQTFSVIVLAINIAALIYHRSTFANGAAEWIFSMSYIIGLILNVLCLDYMKKQFIEI